ncbi:MAG: hypothetical protein QXL67_05125 [Candidatus Bathyarchaeia archaeon]
MSKAPVEYSKVESLKPNLQNLNLIVKILNVGPSRVTQSKGKQREHLIAEAFVGDETGSVILTLFDDQIDRFRANDVIEIRDGYSTLFKGSLRLNVGKTGYVKKTDKEIGEINTRNNLSETVHIQIPWHLSESMPFKKRRRRR